MKKLLLALTLTAMAAVTALAALADGTWRISATTANAPSSLVLTVSGPGLSGTADGVAITNGSVSGAAIFFNVTTNGSTVHYKGTIKGSTLNLFQETYNRALTYTHQ